MKIGYVRVSTLEQNEERQKIELTEKADVEKIFTDKLSGKDTNCPGLRAMLDFVREGDTLFAAITTFERKIILERQREGIAIAKAKGKYKGRNEKQKPKNWELLVPKYKVREITTVTELSKFVVVRVLPFINGLKNLALWLRISQNS